MEPQAQTFVFADLAGYTALTEAHGDYQAAEVVADFCRTVRALLEHHGATEVKTIGDAVMLHATDAADAVCMGRCIVDELGTRHAFPNVRVGIHTGPAVERGGDWFGSAVNIASRVTGAAEEREILVTAATRHAAAGDLEDIEFVAAGQRRLKNVTEPVEVYRAVPAGADERVAWPVDPVCRMAIDPDRAVATVPHGGREYTFCSEECYDAFMRNPALYAGAQEEEPSPRRARRLWRRAR